MALLFVSSLYRADWKGPLAALRQKLGSPVLLGCTGGGILAQGQELYGEPHYDTRTIQKAIGPCPIAGFFCNGEIGPIGSRNYLHGFTFRLHLLPRPLSAKNADG